MMKACLIGYVETHLNATNEILAHDLIKYMIQLYKIPTSYSDLFSVEVRQKEMVFERGQAITHSVYRNQ